MRFLHPVKHCIESTGLACMCAAYTQIRQKMWYFSDRHGFLFNHCPHKAWIGVSCSPLMCLPVNQTNTSANNTFSTFPSSLKSSVVCRVVYDVDTYRNVCEKRLAIFFNILLTDIQHVNLRPWHHNPDQGFVLSASSLNTCTHINNGEICIKYTTPVWWCIHD